MLLCLNLKRKDKEKDSIFKKFGMRKIQDKFGKFLRNLWKWLKNLYFLQPYVNRLEWLKYKN